METELAAPAFYACRKLMRLKNSPSADASVTGIIPRTAAWKLSFLAEQYRITRASSTIEDTSVLSTKIRGILLCRKSCKMRISERGSENMGNQGRALRSSRRDQATGHLLNVSLRSGVRWPAVTSDPWTAMCAVNQGSADLSFTALGM